MSISTHNIKAKSHILTLLGDELIGSDSLAVFELVKNSYDADAEKVTVAFYDLNTSNQTIVIEDDGNGMNHSLIQNVWLTIGTDFKRGINRKESPKFGRVSFGNKGVGRLAVHKLAKKITLESQTTGDLFSTRLQIDWKKLIESKEYIQDLEVEVEDISEKLFDKGHGTRIILSDLTTKFWTRKSLRDLVRKIDNIKNPFSFFSNFNVEISCNDNKQDWIKDIKSSIDILNESLYQFNFEINLWNKDTEDFENNLAEFRWSYIFNPPKETKIDGKIIELKPKSGLDSNTNYFDIGELFKDIDGKDGFNKFLRNRDILDTGKISGKFYVFNQNSLLLTPRFGGQIGMVKDYIKENCGVKIFRDNIRVYNYGENTDDWLGLDLDKIQRTGDHFGKKVTIGFVELDLKSSNDGLIEKTNREGFLDNLVFERFNLIVKAVFNFFEKTTAKDRDEIEAYIDSTKPIKKFGFGDTITELQKKIEEKNLTEILTPLLNQVDKDYNGMRDVMVSSGMTGLNLGVAFHEVDREMKFINADLSREDVNIDEIKLRVKNLIQILDNLSPILRQNKKSSSNALNIADRAKQINGNRFNYHKVIFSSPLISGEHSNFNFQGPTGLLISAISNLIDNAIYWTTTKRDLIGEDFKPAIYIGSDLNTFEGPAIIVVDNGDGFVLDPEYLSQPFKTQKEGGMGLGLYFTDLVMNMMGGKLLFPDNLDLDIPSVYNGACIALVFPKK